MTSPHLVAHLSRLTYLDELLRNASVLLLGRQLLPAIDYVSRRAERVVVADPSAPRIRHYQARSRVRRVDFRVASLRTLDSKRDRFDVIVALDSPEQSDEGWLKDIHSLLKPDGFFALGTPADALRHPLPKLGTSVSSDAPAFSGTNEKAGGTVVMPSPSASPVAIRSDMSRPESWTPERLRSHLRVCFPHVAVLEARVATAVLLSPAGDGEPPTWVDESPAGGSQTLAWLSLCSTLEFEVQERLLELWPPPRRSVHHPPAPSSLAAPSDGDAYDPDQTRALLEDLDRVLRTSPRAPSASSTKRGRVEEDAAEDDADVRQEASSGPDKEIPIPSGPASESEEKGKRLAEGGRPSESPDEGALREALRSLESRLEAQKAELESARSRIAALEDELYESTGAIEEGERIRRVLLEQLRVARRSAGEQVGSGGMKGEASPPGSGMKAEPLPRSVWLDPMAAEDTDGAADVEQSLARERLRSLSLEERIHALVALLRQADVPVPEDLIPEMTLPMAGRTPEAAPGDGESTLDGPELSDSSASPGADGPADGAPRSSVAEALSGSRGEVPSTSPARASEVESESVSEEGADLEPPPASRTMVNPLAGPFDSSSGVEAEDPGAGPLRHVGPVTSAADVQNALSPDAGLGSAGESPASDSNVDLRERLLLPRRMRTLEAHQIASFADTPPADHVPRSDRDAKVSSSAAPDLPGAASAPPFSREEADDVAELDALEVIEPPATVSARPVTLPGADDALRRALIEDWDEVTPVASQARDGRVGQSPSSADVSAPPRASESPRPPEADEPTLSFLLDDDAWSTSESTDDPGREITPIAGSPGLDSAGFEAASPALGDTGSASDSEPVGEGSSAADPRSSMEGGSGQSGGVRDGRLGAALAPSSSRAPSAAVSGEHSSSPPSPAQKRSRERTIWDHEGTTAPETIPQRGELALLEALAEPNLQRLPSVFRSIEGEIERAMVDESLESLLNRRFPVSPAPHARGHAAKSPPLVPEEKRMEAATAVEDVSTSHPVSSIEEEVKRAAGAAGAAMVEEEPGAAMFTGSVPGGEAARGDDRAAAGEITAELPGTPEAGEAPEDGRVDHALDHAAEEASSSSEEGDGFVKKWLSRLKK